MWRAAYRTKGRMLSVLRIVAGLVYVTAGTMKLFDVPPMPHGMAPIALASQLDIAAIPDR